MAWTPCFKHHLQAFTLLIMAFRLQLTEGNYIECFKFLFVLFPNQCGSRNWMANEADDNIRSKQVTTSLFEAKGAKFRQMHVTPTIPMLDQGVGFPVIILVGNCCTRVRIKDVFCKHQVCITPTRTPE